MRKRALKIVAATASVVALASYCGHVERHSRPLSEYRKPEDTMAVDISATLAEELTRSQPTGKCIGAGQSITWFESRSVLLLEQWAYRGSDLLFVRVLKRTDDWLEMLLPHSTVDTRYGTEPTCDGPMGPAPK